MVILIGSILALLFIYSLSYLIGPFSVVLVIALIFGIVLANHFRTKAIYEDLQRIKEKLGVQEDNEFEMNNEEIEKELEQYLAGEDDPK